MLTILTLLGLLNGLVLLPVLLSVIGPPPEVQDHSIPPFPHPPQPCTHISPSPIAPLPAHLSPPIHLCLVQSPPQSIPCPVPSLFYFILFLTHIVLAPYLPDLVPASFHTQLHPSLPDPFDRIPASLGMPHIPILASTHAPYSSVPSPSDLSSLPRHPWWIMAPAYLHQIQYPRVWALGDCTSGALQPGLPPSLSLLTRSTTRRAWGQAAHGDPSLCPLPQHTSYWRLARTPASPALL